MCLQKIFTIFILASSTIMFSCNNDINQYNSELILPPNSKFDTTKYIEKVNLQYTFNRIDLIHSFDSLLLKKNIDTFILKYTPFACLCPYWVIANDTDLQIKNTFVDSTGLYLQSITGLNEIEPFCLNGNTIKIIGREYTKLKYYPPNSNMDSYKPGREFCYYYFEVIKPCKIFGPKMYLNEQDLNGNQLSHLTEIIVK